MRLLIIAQKIDKDDPLLGFFHGWVNEFSKHLKSIVVICLEKKKFNLPDNVAVLSLGKEKWRSKIKYIYLLFYFSLRYYNRYDAVFVHMNEEYPVIAGWMWRLMGKKVYMWRNHHIGNRMTDIASIFCNKVFCTSKFSYTAKYKKTILMPVGIDTEIFKQDVSINQSPNNILSLGRISPTKNIHILIKALSTLKKRGVAFSAHIYGDPPQSNKDYATRLLSQISSENLEGSVKILPGVKNYLTPPIYSSHGIFVNLSPDGMYDKTIFEAMLCGCIVLVSNKNLIGQIHQDCVFDYSSVDDLASKLEKIISYDSENRRKVQEELKAYAQRHSLVNLSEKLLQQIV